MMVLVSWVVSVNWVEVQPLPKIPGKFHDTFVMVPWGPSSSLRSHYGQVPCDGRHQAPNTYFWRESTNTWCSTDAKKNCHHRTKGPIYSLGYLLSLYWIVISIQNMECFPPGGCDSAAKLCLVCVAGTLQLHTHWVLVSSGERKRGTHVKELGRRRRIGQHSGKKRGHRIKREMSGNEGNRTGMESRGRGKAISHIHIRWAVALTM